MPPEPQGYGAHWEVCHVESDCVESYDVYDQMQYRPQVLNQTYTVKQTR